VRVELRGVELYGYHGVEPNERRDGQRFVYDLEFEVGERGADDEIAHAVDYRDVAACLREIAERPFNLLEALAVTIAESLLERFELEWVRVRVRKPEVRPAGLELEFSAVTVERFALTGGR
jgi:dihydroneopterin aldolase